MKHAFAAVALFAAPTVASAQDVDPFDVAGIWLTPAGATIEMYECDASVCGKLVGGENIDPDGASPLDEKNPDPALRDREIVGLVIAEGFERGDDAWENGSVYNLATGTTVTASIKRTDAESLDMKACVGPLCRTVTWTETDAP